MNKTYSLVNWIFAGIFIVILIYSGIYSPNQKYPVKCYYQILYKRPCPTCGLSRGFSAIMRGEFKEASQFNQNSIPLFCFFSIQLFLRLTINCLLVRVKKPASIRPILTTDIAVTVLMFSWAFHRIILSVISL
ncbi:MAG: DUF2752 domain-containing protein [Mucilaginibacter sp.]